jgi:hypothetical protein
MMSVSFKLGFLRDYIKLTLGEELYSNVSKMDYLEVGQKYIIEPKYDTSKKPPMTIESIVEIVGLKPDSITVKFLSGLVEKINTIEDIKYDKYEFTYYNDSVLYKAKPYKEMECENLFLRAAIIIIIWMYIMGIIKIG